MAKNKITTPGYFIKRLRDAGYYVVRLYDSYHKDDERKWTLLLNPKHESLFITCCDKGEWPWRGLFEISDYGQKVPKGFHINTDSVEVILKHLSDFNINNNNAGTFQSSRRRVPSESQEEGTSQKESA